MARYATREFLSNFPNNPRTSILKAIIVLADTYATATSCPSKYASYEFDFPEMIKVKVMNLCELNPSSTWVNSFSNLLLKSLDSPMEIINICVQYLSEICQDGTSFINRKEYANAYK